MTIEVIVRNEIIRIDDGLFIDFSQAIYPRGLKGDKGDQGDDYVLTEQDKEDIAEMARPDVSGKADKVSGATNGNFAGLDANGNLVDSGHKHSDYLTQHQNISGKADKVQSATSGNFAGLDANGNLTDSGSKASDFLTQHQTIPVTDVQVNGTSVLNDGVANIPVTNTSATRGVCYTDTNYGVGANDNGRLFVSPSSSAQVKAGTETRKPISPNHQHESAFYGLATAAGDTTQSASSNAVGNYTETAKSKIHDMLDAPITVSGTTPTIIGKSGITYICGEVSTLSITPPSTGIIDVIFTSGSTPTVLTLPSSIKMPEWWTGTLEANTIYEINIANGLYGTVMTWQV